MFLRSILRRFSRAGRGAPAAPPDRTFWAFISYSHADEAWATWLHDALERYRVPSALVGRTTPAGVVPRRLLPIFRDRDELPGSPDLEHEITQALVRSRSLIVISSPHAAASRYVDQEIVAFKRLGRESDIYCLLVDGEPYATDKPESGLPEAFPAAIRFRVGPDGALTAERAEPLAADVRKGKDTRANAKLKIIAGILGIGFDELRRREARRQLHQRLQLAAVALAVLAVVAGVWWNRQRALESQRQIALAQRLVDQSTELLDSEDPDGIQRGVLLILQALIRLDREAPDLSEDGEAAQARLAADQNLRQALSLLATPATPLSAAPPAEIYADRGWASWTAEAVGFSQDGQMLTAASGWGRRPTAAIARWRLDTGIESRRVRINLPGERFDWPTPTDRSNPRYFALSPDAGFLATIADSESFGGPSEALLYRIPEDREMTRVVYQGRITGVALGPRGEYLAIAATARDQPLPLRLWHVPSGRLVAGIPDDPSALTTKALAFSRDGRRLAVAGERISLWELPLSEGERVARPGPMLDLYRGEAVAFSPDGRYVAAAGTEGTAFAGGQAVEFGRRIVRVWDVAQSRAVSTFPAPETVRGLALSADGRYLAVVDDDHSLVLRALGSGRALRVHFNPSDPSGRLAGRSRSMNLSAKGPRARGRLAAVAFSPSDDLMAMAGETDAVVWRLSSFDQQVVLTVDGKVEDTAFDRDERSAITVHRTGDARTIAVRAWDVGSGRELPERRAQHVADAFTLTRTGDLVLATDAARGSGRGGAAVVVAGETIGPFRYEGDARRMFVTRDGRYLAVAASLGASAPTPVSPGRHQVTVWDLESRAEVRRFDYTTAERDSSHPRAFFILGNRWYLGVDDGETLEDGARRSTFVLWDVKSGERRPERTDDIMRLLRDDLATSADGRWVAFESGDEIRVLTATNLREVARIPIPVADRDSFRLGSTLVALGAAGRNVAAITAGSTVRLWPLDASRLVSLACSRLTRDLSPEEWTAYLPTEDPEPVCAR